LFKSATSVVTNYTAWLHSVDKQFYEQQEGAWTFQHSVLMYLVRKEMNAKFWQTQHALPFRFYKSKLIISKHIACTCKEVRTHLSCFCRVWSNVSCSRRAVWYLCSPHPWRYVTSSDMLQWCPRDSHSLTLGEYTSESYKERKKIAAYSCICKQAKQSKGEEKFKKIMKSKLTLLLICLYMRITE